MAIIKNPIIVMNQSGGSSNISKMIDRSITEITAEDIGSATDIGQHAFYGCGSLRTITFPSNGQITQIRTNAFRDCTSLTGIVIPSGVESISNSAFYGCSSLTQIDIPDTVETIGQQAFRLCSAVKTLKIGSGVTSIGSQAFRNLASNVIITITATNPPTLGATDVFSNTGSGPIYVPAGSVNDYIADTNWSTYSSRIQAIPTT